MNRASLRRTIRKIAWLQSCVWRAEATFLYLFWLLSRSMQPGQASAFGGRLFRWLGPRLGKQQFVERNLKLAFPALKKSQRDSLARDIWGNFGAVLAEYPHLHSYWSGGDSPSIELKIDRQTGSIIEHREPAVYISAHLGNWELAASAIVKTGVPLSVVYAPQGNPWVDRMLQMERHALGCRFITKKHAIRNLVRELRSGRSVGILPDQRSDAGALVPFFGLDAMTATSPAWLAQKTACPLIPVQIERIEYGRYRAIFHEPVSIMDKQAGQEGVLQLTAVVNQLFESWIRCCPDQWLCMRRRWPVTDRYPMRSK